MVLSCPDRGKTTFLGNKTQLKIFVVELLLALVFSMRSMCAKKEKSIINSYK